MSLMYYFLNVRKLRDTPSIFEPHLRDGTTKKVQVGNGPEKAQSERNSHSKNRVGKIKLVLRKHIVE